MLSSLRLPLLDFRHHPVCDCWSFVITPFVIAGVLSSLCLSFLQLEFCHHYGCPFTAEVLSSHDCGHHRHLSELMRTLYDVLDSKKSEYF